MQLKRFCSKPASCAAPQSGYNTHMQTPLPDPFRRGRSYASAFYLFYYGAQACFFPFLTIYYQQLGLSGSQIGLLAGFSPVISLISAPFWSGLSDATGRHRLVLSLGLSGAAGGILLMMQAQSLLWLAVAVACYAFFSAAIIPLADSATMHMLGGEKGNYGKIRLWGSIGWGAAAPLAGLLMDRFGPRGGFSASIVLMAVVLLVSLGMSHSRGHLSVPFWHGVRQVLADRRWYPFLGLVLIGGMSMSVVSAYLLLYMNSLGANRTVMGLTQTIATISEIPVLFFVNRLIKRFGARPLMAVSIAAYALRAFLVSLATVPETILLIQTIHGATFALLIGAGVTMADELAPAGLKATAQGLYGAVMGGVGVTTGAVLGGWIYEHYGAPATFRVMSIVALLGLLLWAVFDRLLQRSSSPAKSASTSTR
jgi:PPP family 3-phenylpropionic acid transporter